MNINKHRATSSPTGNDNVAELAPRQLLLQAVVLDEPLFDVVLVILAVPNRVMVHARFSLLQRHQRSVAAHLPELFFFESSIA